MDAVPTVRAARPGDADDIARVYIDSWHDTYPGTLPVALLSRMTQRGQSARWKAVIAARGRHRVMVAEAQHIVGMASFGPARDTGSGFDSEVYTLYVDPDYFGQGVGRALLDGCFEALRDKGCRTCIIWAHARNNARFFYEAMGGRLVAERVNRLMGTPTPEAAFGWTEIANGPH